MEDGIVHLRQNTIVLDMAPARSLSEWVAFDKDTLQLAGWYIFEIVRQKKDKIWKAGNFRYIK